MTKLRHINIEVTNDCNQNCYYCFNNSGSDKNNRTVSLNQWLGLIKHLKNCGLQSVHFTGGEPFVYSDIIPLIKGSIDLGLEVSILSNGHKIMDYSAQFPEILAQLTVAQISLDSIIPEFHNKRRNYFNAWQDAMDAIHSLRKLKVPVEISSTIDSGNINSIEELAKFAFNNDLGLIIRPVLNQGRAKYLFHDSKLANSIEKEIRNVQEVISVRIVNDRFNYLSYSEVQRIPLPLESLTINYDNFDSEFSEYFNELALQ